MKNESEPELYAGRCNGKTLNRSAWLFERAIYEAIKGKKPENDSSCVEIKIPDEVLMGEYTDDFVGAIINDTKRHIADTVADILSTDGEYIMSLSLYSIDANPMDFTRRTRIRLIHKPLVRCRDCVYCKKAFNGELMCNHPSFLHFIDQSDGYCHHGKKPDLTDYLLKEKPDVDSKM